MRIGMARQAPDKPSLETERRPKATVRTCAGCGERSAKDAMVRVVLGPGGELAFDLVGHSHGRGAYLHPARRCFERAARGGLSKAFRQSIRCETELLFGLVDDAVERRVRGLLASAKNAGGLAFGREHVEQEWFEEKTRLVVVAVDGPWSEPPKFLQRAVSAGKAVVWGDRAKHGSLFDLGDVTVVGVRNASIANAIAEACRLPDKVRAGAEVR